MNEITLLYVILAIVILLEIQMLYTVKGSRRHKRSSLEGACFIDTSVLMDGRIVAVVQTGFIPQKLAIPRSVLNELQLLADGGDSEKRARARHGLDVAKQLQDEPAVNVHIVEDSGTSEGVDRHLITLAKKHEGSICTNDFNLNKVAQVEQVRVLNINDLARQIKINYLPGERVSIEILQKGNDAHQGVGYLADGTMVVVDKAHKDIGSHIQVEFIRSLQTAAGRMLFAKKVSNLDKSSTRSSNVQQQAKGRSKRQPRSSEASLVELANK